MVGRVVGRLVAGILVGILLAVGGVAFAVWKVARDDTRQHADTIVVLGSAQYNGTPSPNFKSRLTHALSLYQDGLADVIVTVGGNRSGDEYTEAGAGRNWLIKQGVPADAVVAVPTGSNTLQSAVALGKEFKQKGWTDTIVVTDPWHTLRASEMITAEGITTYISPTRSGPSVQTRSTEFQYILRETAAILYYGLTGNSNETGLGIG
ncbi:DUF218 domain-containing protein [Antricoccus suffuscus]|uniref:DUF218 domain-containing protein n=1 Tax=Antricoccus suffuscus TaxID=1629062 RepID=A0A2T0Z4T5_9ACTN|nr:YdcF family protein [Antricoccus suffuscus]PRZ31367.1 DUF218 domain-containing protein [Antricoccus suffuscus]